MAVSKTNALHELSGGFAGFNPEAFTFLKKLAKNNQREWFLPRKPIFEEQLQKPMARLLFAIERELAKKKLPLAANPKSVLFRIYRDIRFSEDKSPYHTHVSGALSRNGKKDTPGMLYVHIGEKEQFAGIGFWQPERPALTNWRLSMQAAPKKFLEVVKQLKRKGLELSNTYSLKRMPRGFEALEKSPLAGFLRLQSFAVIRPITKAEVLSPDLPLQIARFALAAKPLLDYGWDLPEAKPHQLMD